MSLKTFNIFSKFKLEDRSYKLSCPFIFDKMAIAIPSCERKIFKTKNLETKPSRKGMSDISFFRLHVYLGVNTLTFTLSWSCRAKSIVDDSVCYLIERSCPKTVVIVYTADLTCDIRWCNKGIQVHFSQFAFSIHSTFYFEWCIMILYYSQFR